MIVHLSARGHKGGVVKGDCGATLAGIPHGDMIMIGEVSDWKGGDCTFCPDCVLIGAAVPEAERAK